MTADKKTRHSARTVGGVHRGEPTETCRLHDKHFWITVQEGDPNKTKQKTVSCSQHNKSHEHDTRATHRLGSFNVVELNLFMAVTYFACTVPNSKLAWNSTDTHPCYLGNTMLCWAMCVKSWMNTLESNEILFQDVFVSKTQTHEMWNHCQYTQCACVTFGCVMAVSM